MSSTASPRSARARSASAPRAPRRTATVADFVAAEMREMGSAGVAVEHRAGRRLAPRARRAWPSPAAPSTNAPRWAAALPRRPGASLAPLVDVGTGERRRLDRLDVAGRIALLDWRSVTSPVSEIGLELGLRGALESPSTAPTADPSTSRRARSARSRRTGTTVRRRS